MALVLVLNVGGWRARVIAKLMEVNNPPLVVPPPPEFKPHVPPGFRVNVFARGFDQPRWMATAPNADTFVADSYPGRIIVLQDPNRQGQAEARFTFAENLRQPFGIAFHEDHVYIGDTDEVLRIRYDPRTSRALGEREHILDLPGGGYRQHWTRTLAFSPDGFKLFVSIGSKWNEAIESDPRRAAIVVSDPDGKNAHIYASGLRNAVGIAFNPQSGELWAAVNERDQLGDDQPEDYFTHVVEGGFYGWPYSFLGSHVDNRVSSRPDLVAKALVPDLLLGRTWPHSSSSSTKLTSFLPLTYTALSSPNTAPGIAACAWDMTWFSYRSKTGNPPAIPCPSSQVLSRTPARERSTEEWWESASRQTARYWFPMTAGG